MSASQRAVAAVEQKLGGKFSPRDRAALVEVLDDAVADGARKFVLLKGMVESAIKAADWEPGDAQRALRDLRDDFAALGEVDRG